MFVFMSFIFVVLFVCSFQVRCVSFSLPASVFNKRELRVV